VVYRVRVLPKGTTVMIAIAMLEVRRLLTQQHAKRVSMRLRKTMRRSVPKWLEVASQILLGLSDTAQEMR
jgi:hypothetical protein